MENPILRDIAKSINEKFFGSTHEFVQTSPCGRGERHPHGMVGNLFQIGDPLTIRGHVATSGKLKSGDMVLCIAHSGDCFQTYTKVQHNEQGYFLDKDCKFGSYGIGDAEKIDTPSHITDILKAGKVVNFN